MPTQKNFKTGMMYGAILTVLIVAAALVGSLIYVAFYANGLSLFQSVVIIIVVLAIAFTLVSILWMVWWMPYMTKFNAKEWQMKWK
jgi:uncharacterized membrane protein YdbT with pleckstrin-like domain